MNIRAYKITIPAVIIIVGILLRSYIAFAIKPFSGDSAVFALMAKHISEFREFYIYMPLAHYAGAMSSYIGAALFTAFGVSYNSFISGGLIFSSVGLIAGCILSRKILDGFGELISDLLIAIPSVFIIRYSIFAGVLAENALFIPLLLLIAVKINVGDSRRPGLLATISGVVSGIALWATPSSFPAILTVITLLMMTRHRRLPSAAVILFFMGLLIGYTPAIIYNFQNPNATLFRMAGRVLSLDRSALSCPDLPALIFRQICWRLSTVPDSLYRIPRLMAELISFPGMLLFCISTIIVFTGRLSRWFDNRRLDGVGVVLLYTLWNVIFYPLLVGEAASRYMMPLVLAGPFLIGDALSSVSKWTGRFLIIAIAAVFLYYNVSTVKASASLPDSGRYAHLADWLVKNNALYGYSDYDTAYITDFDTLEKATISPTLFHPTFADRWPDKTKEVRNSQNVCYIIDRKRYTGLIKAFENNLAALGLPVNAHQVDGFAVYRDIPGNVRPGQLIPIGDKQERR